jgi:regulator of ribosome biosynthesis
MKKLFELPTEITEVGPVAILPNPFTAIPREKRIPDPKPETKWEKFAKEKGIKNKKRERMIFDEVDQQYKPRYGYKRANNGIQDIPIVEIKAGDDPYKDPWTEEKQMKRQKVEKNKKQQVKNILRAKGKSGTTDPSKIPGIPVDIKGEKKRGKEGVRRALQLAQYSTASMGRFDESLPGEPTKKLKGKKQSFRSNVSNNSSELAIMKANIRIVHDKADKKARGVTNSLAAYEGILPDAPDNSFKQKKGKGKGKTDKKKK